MPREEFLALLEKNDIKKTYRGRWSNNTVVLLIGSNQGDRVSLLMHAVMEIANRIGTVSLVSSMYETEPWGFDAEQNFLNQAVVVDTDLNAFDVLRKALEIEKELGRVRPTEDVATFSVLSTPLHVKEYKSRPIDIDLIFFNSEIVDAPDLQLPHPRMHMRRFVLEPLAQIIPDFKHPKLRKTIRQLLEECTDKGDVRLYF
ncbi:MAG: 2-amino-4-hydroxy-6-hydroxymethyldihydropteridine diphosphokinase [Bacteroidales bacterium]|nr:2-amino-4-hydroxy-6-hydroxymethyldihydropteridine diphosphokinase [Bacteroidales bacterium]